MKKTITNSIFIMLCMSLLGQVSPPIYEEFDTAPDGNKFGVFFFNNYGASDSEDPNFTSYTFEQDATGMLSGANSAKLNIASSGDQWWTIQVRLEDLVVEAGETLRISFIALSSLEMSFLSRVEATDGTHDPFDYQVNVAAFERKVVDYETPVFPVRSNNNYMLALGNTVKGGELWIDSVSITVPNQGVGVANVDHKEAWRVFTNTEFITLRNYSAAGKINVELFDLVGRKVYSEWILHEETSTIAIHNLKPGIYIARLLNEHNDLLSSEKISIRR